MIKFLDLQKINLQYKTELSEDFERVLQSGWFIRGIELELFENEFAAYCGSKYCIGVANGLDALILILEGYKEMGLMKDGDEIRIKFNLVSRFRLGQRWKRRREHDVKIW